MSEVYLAMSGHYEFETVCVVKRLMPALAAQAEHARRFRHEADLARRLSHSNLVSTHNIGEVDGEVFLVQEFVEGQDVSRLLDELGKRRRSLPIPIAAYIASEIARGLSYAHSFEGLELVHRDINQPNVRLTYAGEVKLLDFGIASSNLHGERANDQGVRGKLWHLAPEQLEPGGIVDRRADIYAVGVLLWELLTNRPVGTTRAGTQEGRTAETEGEVMVWITRGQHQAASAFNPDVPPELDAVVARAMHIRPDQRYASADELRRALAAFVALDFHPEEQLAGLMKDFFPPERERSQRQRLIEAARGLLVREEPPSRVPQQAIEVSDQGPGLVRRHAVWAGPVAVGALIGIGALFYLRRTGSPDGEPALLVQHATATVTATAPTNVRPMARPATAPTEPDSRQAASVRSSSPRPTGTKGERPGGAPPGAVPQAAALHPAAVAASATATATTAAGSETASAKINHLDLARRAFNERDWPRALAESKLAATAGGGADAYALIGNTYFKMGRFADAEASYVRAVALDPKNALLQERLSIAHARAEQEKPRQRHDP
jgi:hypothetical protein